jgi:hypothetical protein
MTLMGIPAMLMGCLSKAGQAQHKSPSNDADPDAALKYKFRGIRGGEKRIDAVQSISGVAIYLEDGWVFASGVFGRGPSSSSYGGGGPGDQLVIPKVLRMILYGPGYQRTRRDSDFGAYEGEIVKDVTVPVAERIPEDLLEDLRRNPKGSLRLKLRIHPDTLLVGWDIERRPGFDPKKRDSFGEIAYVSPGWVKTGGDFKEARGVYWLEDESGNLVRAPRPETMGGVMPPELARRGIVFNQHGFLREKGWYIHPKTGERIETDF